jgi:hypothetical protein
VEECEVCGNIQKVKTVVNDINIDAGAFLLGGIQVHFVLKNREKVNQQLELVADVDPYYSKGEIWRYVPRKPLKAISQIYIWDVRDNSWIDASVTTAAIKDRYDNNQAEKCNYYHELFQQLLEIGFSVAKAQERMHNGRWKETEEFIRILKLLRKRRPSRRSLEKASYFYSKAHFENVLKLQCKNLNGARDAIAQYRKELECE